MSKPDGKKGPKKKPEVPKVNQRSFRIEANRARRQAKHAKMLQEHQSKVVAVPRGTARATRRNEIDWHQREKERRAAASPGRKVFVNGQEVRA